MEVENSGQQEVGGYNCSLGSLSFLLLGSTSWLEESSAWCTCQKKPNTWNYRSSVASERGTAHPQQDRDVTNPDALGLQEHLDTISWQN